MQAKSTRPLQTIDADTLQSTAYEPVSFVVDDLLPQGLHLLAGAPRQTALDVRYTAMRGAVPLSGGQLPAYPEPPL